MFRRVVVSLLDNSRRHHLFQLCTDTSKHVVSVCRHCTYTECLPTPKHIVIVPIPTLLLYVLRRSLQTCSLRPQLKQLSIAFTLATGNVNSCLCWLNGGTYTYFTLSRAHYQPREDFFAERIALSSSEISITWNRRIDYLTNHSLNAFVT